MSFGVVHLKNKCDVFIHGLNVAVIRLLILVVTYTFTQADAKNKDNSRKPRT
jgi:hypothetical protein